MYSKGTQTTDAGQQEDEEEGTLSKEAASQQPHKQAHPAKIPNKEAAEAQRHPQHDDQPSPTNRTQTQGIFICFTSGTCSPLMGTSRTQRCTEETTLGI